MRRYPYGSSSRWDRDDYDRDDLFDNDRQQRERYPEHYGSRGAHHDAGDRYDMARYDYGREYDGGSERDDHFAERGYRGDTAGAYDRTHHRGIGGRHFGYGNERPYGAAYAGGDRYGYNHDFGGDNPRRDDDRYDRPRYETRHRPQYERHSAMDDRGYHNSGSYGRDPFARRTYEQERAQRSQSGGLGNRIRRGFGKIRHDMRNWEHRPVVGRDEEIDSRRGYVRDNDYRMTGGPGEWDRDDDWRWRR